MKDIQKRIQKLKAYHPTASEQAFIDECEEQIKIEEGKIESAQKRIKEIEALPWSNGRTGYIRQSETDEIERQKEIIKTARSRIKSLTVEKRKYHDEYRHLKAVHEGKLQAVKEAQADNDKARNALKSIRETAYLFEDITDSEKMEWQSRKALEKAEEEERQARNKLMSFEPSYIKDGTELKTAIIESAKEKIHSLHTQEEEVIESAVNEIIEVNNILADISENDIYSNSFTSMDIASLYNL